MSEAKKPGFFGRLFGGEKSAPPEPVAATPRLSWWKRLSGGLSRTASTISAGITTIFTTRKLDADTLSDLEDVLISADLGVEVVTQVTKTLDGRGLRNDVPGARLCHHHMGMGKRLQMPGLAADGFTHTLGKQFDFTFAGRQHSEQSIGIRYIAATEDQHMGGANTRSCCHLVHYTRNQQKSGGRETTLHF